MSEVKVGQIWADNDKRMSGRRVRVVEIVNVHLPFRASQPAAGTPHAVVDPVDVRGNPTGARRTRVRLDRFKPTATGFVLAEDSP